MFSGQQNNTNTDGNKDEYDFTKVFKGVFVNSLRKVSFAFSLLLGIQCSQLIFRWYTVWSRALMCGIHCKIKIKIFQGFGTSSSITVSQRRCPTLCRESLSAIAGNAVCKTVTAHNSSNFLRLICRIFVAFYTNSCFVVVVVGHCRSCWKNVSESDRKLGVTGCPRYH